MQQIGANIHLVRYIEIYGMLHVPNNPIMKGQHGQTKGLTCHNTIMEG